MAKNWKFILIITTVQYRVATKESSVTTQFGVQCEIILSPSKWNVPLFQFRKRWRSWFSSGIRKSPYPSRDSEWASLNCRRLCRANVTRSSKLVRPTKSGTYVRRCMRRPRWGLGTKHVSYIHLCVYWNFQLTTNFQTKKTNYKKSCIILNTRLPISSFSFQYLNSNIFINGV